jgi:hypothetical protein
MFFLNTRTVFKVVNINMYRNNIINSYTVLPLCTLSFLFPLVVFAGLCPGDTNTCTFSELSANVIVTILDPLINILFALMAMLFILGIVRYINSANNTTQREKAKKFMINALIGIFVVISMWGIILIIKSGLDLNTTMPTL